MDTELIQLLCQTTLNPPCEPEELAHFIDKFGPNPHQDYLDFMARHNGCEGPIGEEGYLSIWSIENIIDWEKQLAEFSDGLLCFGGDGGGEGFAFDTQDPQWPIVMVPLIISREDLIVLAPTFLEFLRRVAKSDLFD